MPAPTNFEEVAQNIEQLGTQWEAFKKLNDQRIAEIEKRGSADPLITGQLEKLNGLMNGHEDAIKNLTATVGDIEKLMARNDRGDKTDAKTAEMKAYETGFNAYLRKGIDNGLDVLEQKALSVNSDPDGGYLVTPALSNTIITIINETSPLRALASVQTISTDALEMLDDRGVLTSGWVAETGSRPATANTQIGKKNIPTHEIYAQPIATQKLLDDASLNIESWLAGKASEAFALKENTAFISGNGVGQPRGILTYAAGTSWGQVEQVNSGSSGAVTADGLISLFYSLKDGYTNGSSFLMKRSTIKAVRQLKENTTNQYIWQPGLQAGQPSQLLGAPVYEAADMPAVGVDALAIAFGNWKRAYQIVDRLGVRLLRDPFTNKPFVQFYFTKRVGGDVINFEAFKIQKLA